MRYFFKDLDSLLGSPFYRGLSKEPLRKTDRLLQFAGIIGTDLS